MHTPTLVQWLEDTAVDEITTVIIPYVNEKNVGLRENNNQVLNLLQANGLKYIIVPLNLQPLDIRANWTVRNNSSAINLRTSG